MEEEKVEEWRDVVGFEGIYQVSSLGRLKRCECTVTYKSGRTVHYKEKMMSDDTINLGYMENHLSSVEMNLPKDKARPGGYRRHRLVAEAFIPNPDNLPFVLHINDNPLDNRVENLRWGTAQDNANDRKNHNRSKKEFIEENQKLLDVTTGIEYSSLKEASELTGLTWKGITDSAYSGCTTIDGHNWKWISENRQERSKIKQKVVDLENEIWKDIPGLEDKYQISNYYRIKSLPRLVQSSVPGKQRRTNEKILKQNYDNYFVVYVDREDVPIYPYELVKQLFTEEERRAAHN